MDCYLVGVRNKAEDGQMYTLLLYSSELADLLLNIDDEKYEIGEIVKTFSDKAETILPFCKIDKALETGEEEKETT